MASALTDGVILCHLANHVSPRSVVSIHVPSPGISKLTMARCRRNVDNFLDACRKIGIDEELICSCEDVVSTQEENYSRNDDYQPPRLPNPTAVFKTVSELLSIDANSKNYLQGLPQVYQEQQPQSMERHQSPATNMQLTENWENKLNSMREIIRLKDQFEHETIVTNGSQLRKFLRHDKIKTFQKKQINFTNNNSNMKINSSGGKEAQLQTIEETHSDSYQIFNEKVSPLVLKVNGLNTIKFELLEITAKSNKKENTKETLNAVSQFLSKSYNTVTLTKRIEFFEDHVVSRSSPSDANTTPKNIFSIHQTNNEDNKFKIEKDDRVLNHDFNLLTVVLSFVFIGTFILLLIFPLPD